MDREKVAVDKWTVPQILAGVIGAVFLIIGLAGWFVTGFDNFASHNTDTLLGFQLNPLHNIVHLIIGAAGLATAGRLASARLFGWALVIGYGAAFLYGLWAVNRDDVNFLALNTADNWLHLISAILGMGVALLPARAAARTRTVT